jgi:hypothetical protein
MAQTPLGLLLAALAFCSFVTSMVVISAGVAGRLPFFVFFFEGEPGVSAFSTNAFLFFGGAISGTMI